MEHRAIFFQEVLKAVAFLSEHYGYFSLAEGMIGKGRNGQLLVWISDDVTENNRKLPIDFGIKGEQIFVKTFNNTFEEHLKDLGAF